MAVVEIQGGDNFVNLRMDNNCGVYIVISPSKGRYIGSSKNLKKRFNRYKNLSCHNQYALISSFKKYGFDNHIIKVLIYCEEKELLFWERIFGDLYLSLADFKNGLNIRLPGYGEIPQSLTEEMRKRIKEGCRKRWAKTEEREKTSQRAKIALQSKDLRDRLRESAINQWDEKARNKKSEERKKYYQDNPQLKEQYSKKIKEYRSNNPEVANRCNSALVNYYKNNPSARSEQAKRRFKNNPNHPTATKVINIETNQIFSSIESLAKILGVTGTTVTNRIKSKKYFPYQFA